MCTSSRTERAGTSSRRTAGVVSTHDTQADAEQAGKELPDQADKELPDKVDPERDSGLLSKFGVDPSERLGKFGGGKIPGL